MQDQLGEMFLLQKELNQRIGVDLDSMDTQERISWVLNYVLALRQELSELVDSVPWKWWAKYQEYDEQNAKVEVVDCFHFLISIAQALGMDEDELYELYTKKNELNHKRQDSGYTTKDAEDNKSLG